MKVGRRSSFALAGLVLAGVAISGLAVLGGRSAFATTPPSSITTDAGATLGGIDFYDASGTQITTGSTATAPFAAFAVAQDPKDLTSGVTKIAEYAYTPVSGQLPANWSGEQLSVATAFPVASPAGLHAISNPVQTGASNNKSLATYIVDQPNADTSSTDGYAGIYVIRLQDAAGDYAKAEISISGTTWTQVASSFTSPVSGGGGGGGATTTSTVVTASPASPQPAGTSVTFTATVSPAAAGSVQFMDGASTLGPSTALTLGASSGTATYAPPSLASGSHSITAVFTPTTPASFAASTSAAVSYTINAAGAVTTTTTLAATPASSAATGASVVFTASVLPATAVGSVQFLDGTTALGSPVTVANGAATYTTTTTTALAVGTHSITAAFTPTTPTAFTASTSTVLSYKIYTPGPATTTALAVSPASTAASGATVTLTATLTCTTACTPTGTTPAGMVTFWDGSIQVGTTQTLASGTATVSTTTLAVGSTHSFIALYTPTDPSVFSPSQSAAIPYTITAADGGTATLTTSSGATLGADPNLTLGESVTVAVGGFTPGESVAAVVHSVPETLTPTTATTTGTVSYLFTVPADLPAGAHTLVLTGATSGFTVTVAFTVGSTTVSPTVLGTTFAAPSSSSLPFTGADITLMCTMAIGLLCAGFYVRFGVHGPVRSGSHVRHGPRHSTR